MRPGERWNRQTKRVERDRLRTLEDWAQVNPSAMTPKNWGLLTDLRSEYQRVTEALLEYAACGVEFSMYDLAMWADMIHTPRTVACAVYDRLMEAKKIRRDWVKERNGSLWPQLNLNGRSSNEG